MVKNYALVPVAVVRRGLRGEPSTYVETSGPFNVPEVRQPINVVSFLPLRKARPYLPTTTTPPPRPVTSPPEPRVTVSVKGNAVGRIDDSIARQERQIRTLIEARDAVIKKSMSVDTRGNPALDMQIHRAIKDSYDKIQQAQDIVFALKNPKHNFVAHEGGRYISKPTKFVAKTSERTYSPAEFSHLYGDYGDEVVMTAPTPISKQNYGAAADDLISAAGKELRAVIKELFPKP